LRLAAGAGFLVELGLLVGLRVLELDAGGGGWQLKALVVLLLCDAADVIRAICRKSGRPEICLTSRWEWHVSKMQGRGGWVAGSLPGCC
jgi:hypothetical protein